MAFGAHTRFLTVAFWGLALAVTVLAAPLAAAPLDKEACDKLQAEKQSLTVLGVEKDMAKGADWAKANMKPAQLDMVKRFISVDEQLKFRCRPALAEPKPAVAKGAKQAKATPAQAAAEKPQPAAAKPGAKAAQAKGAPDKAAAQEDTPDDKEQE